MPAIAYRNLSQTEFDYLLKSQSNANYLSGGSIRDIGIFKTNARLRGGSIFSILASVGRRVLPFLSRYVAPVAKSVGKNIVNDVIQGENIKTSLKRHGIDGVKQIGSRILRGGNKKRKVGGGRIGQKKKKSATRKLMGGKKKPASRKRGRKAGGASKKRKRKPVAKRRTKKTNVKRRKTHHCTPDIFM